MTRRLLVLSGGHPYEADEFEQLIHSLGDWQVAHLVHPEAEEEVANGAMDKADAVLFYDMPGYTFADGKVISRPPSPAYRKAVTQRFASGKGAVAMHHAIAGWAEWAEWHEWLGGKFFYQPGEWQGAAVPDSGYRHDVEYTANRVADHPVLDGVPDQFTVCDELYLAPIDESALTPLIRAEGFAFERDNFYSAANAVAGDMFSQDGWDHPPQSNCVAWECTALKAPIIYLQFGDGPQTYANPHVRRLLSNALHFTSGDPQ